MGIFKGNATISRYLVRGKQAGFSSQELDQRIRRFAFKPIEDGTEELSVGWVSVNDFLDLEFAYASYALDPYLILGLRIDRRRLPGALLKKYHRLEMQKAKEMGSDKGLSRSEREELKEKARLDLLTRLPPQTQALDVCWDSLGGQVWLGSGSAPVKELFEDLFRRTFELELEPVQPWTLAQRLVEPEGHSARLESAAPLTLYVSRD
jgi:DNA recombination-dependent growth factor C